MSLLKSLATDATIESDVDSLGTSKFAPWESGAYPVVIDLAYVDESKGGAMSINFTFKTQEGRELNQNIYVTSGKEKGQLNHYVGKDGTKRYLPGFTVANDIALLTMGEELSTLDTETKVLSLYNYDQKKEVPTKKEVLTDLIGKEVTLGIYKIIKDKYNAPGETQTINEIVKVFRESDNKTANEIKSDSNAEFYDTWVEKNTGITINRVGKSKDTPAATAKVETKPAKSLFA
jgi:hypothetical protein